MVDYTGKSREPDPERKSETEEKKIRRVAQGEVIQKKKPLSVRFKSLFFGGDARLAVRFLREDILVPALQHLIFDIVSEGLRGMLWGSDPRYYHQSPASRIPYNQQYRYDRGRMDNPIFSRPYEETRVAAGPINAMSRIRKDRRDLTDVILPNKQEAEDILNQMVDVLEMYDTVSLADFYAMLGLEGSHLDNKWGWRNLRGIDVRQTRQGYLLVLPPLEPI